MSSQTPKNEAAHLIRSSEKVVVYSGAGMSQESGISTFRGATAGDISPADMTADILASDPDRLNATLDKQRAAVEGAQPNAGHHALGDNARRRVKAGGSIHLFTTNVDNLHQEVWPEGTVYALHGKLDRDRCTDDGCRFRSGHGKLSTCELCGSPMRADVILYGEREDVEASHNLKRSLRSADLLLVVGASGATMGLSKTVRTATRDYQIPTVLWSVDPEPEFAAMFDVVVNAPASELPTDMSMYGPGNPEESSSGSGRSSFLSRLRSNRA